jgi:tetratricopeptide (TPR) repeat protein
MSNLAIGRAVQELEREVGAPLLTETLEGLQLTQAGTALCSIYQRSGLLWLDSKSAGTQELESSAEQAEFEKNLKLAIDYGSGGQHTQAAEIYRTLINTKVGRRFGLSDLWMRHAYQSMFAGRFEEAVMAFENAGVTDRDGVVDNDELLLLQGICLFQNGQYESSLAIFQRAAQKRILDGRAAYWSGCALRALGRYEDAIGFFTRAATFTQHTDESWRFEPLFVLRLGRTRTDALIELARTLNAVGRPGEANAALNNAVLSLVPREREAEATAKLPKIGSIDANNKIVDTSDVAKDDVPYKERHFDEAKAEKMLLSFDVASPEDRRRIIGEIHKAAHAQNPSLTSQELSQPTAPTKKRLRPINGRAQWINRDKNKAETPVDFVKRVYADRLPDLSRAQILDADAGLYRALRYWEQKHGAFPEGFLPTRLEEAERRIQEFQTDGRLEDALRVADALRTRQRRRQLRGPN